MEIGSILKLQGKKKQAYFVLFFFVASLVYKDQSIDERKIGFYLFFLNCPRIAFIPEKNQCQQKRSAFP